MKTRVGIIACVVLLVSVGAVFGQGEKAAYGATISTNLAYLTLTALSCSSSSALIIAPVYCEIMLNDYLSVNPSEILIYSSSATTSHAGLISLTELGLAYHPNAKGHDGFLLGITPGIAYSFDSNRLGYTLSASAGYQWIIKDRWVVGATAGGRYIFIDGQILIPDLGINVGYKM